MNTRVPLNEILCQRGNLTPELDDACYYFIIEKAFVIKVGI